jgi:phage terminase Nu1 subunit (DNA packaging protein)
LALSSEAPPVPLGAAPVLVNKAEVAGILGISLPTLAAWIARYSDFPVYERGANGREWRFDAAAVRAWELSRREAEARDEAARRDLLAQFALPLTDPGDAATGDGVASLEEIRRIRESDKLRLERGFLVDVSSLRQQLTAAVTKWNRATHATLRQAARDLNLPDAVARELQARLADAQTQFLRDLRADADQSLAHAAE